MTNESEVNWESLRFRLVLDTAFPGGGQSFYVSFKKPAWHAGTKSTHPSIWLGSYNMGHVSSQELAIRIARLLNEDDERSQRTI